MCWLLVSPFGTFLFLDHKMLTGSTVVRQLITDAGLS